MQTPQSPLQEEINRLRTPVRESVNMPFGRCFCASSFRSGSGIKSAAAN